MKKALVDPRIAAFDDHEGKVKYIIAYCDDCGDEKVHTQNSPGVVPTCEHVFTKHHSKAQVDYLTGRTDSVPPPRTNGAGR